MLRLFISIPKFVERFGKKYPLYLTIVLTYLLYLIVSGSISTLNFLDPFNPETGSFDFYDIYYKEFQNLSQKEDEDLFVVDINDLNRGEIIECIGLIADLNPKVIGVDVYFDFESDTLYFNNLINTIQNCNSPFVLAVPSSQVNEDCAFNEYYNELSNYALLGHSALSTDRYFSPRIVHKQLICEEEDIIRSFSSEISKIYNPEILVQDDHRIQWSLKELKKLEELGSIKDRGGAVIALTKERLSQDFAKNLENKIVLVGMGNNKFLLDKFYSPYNSTYFQRSKPDMPGVLVHANAIKSKLSNNKIKTVPTIFQWILSFLISFSALKILIVYKPKTRIWKLIKGLIFTLVLLGLFTIFIILFGKFHLRFEVGLFLIPILLLEPTYSFVKFE